MEHENCAKSDLGAWWACSGEKQVQDLNTPDLSYHRSSCNNAQFVKKAKVQFEHQFKPKSMSIRTFELYISIPQQAGFLILNQTFNVATLFCGAENENRHQYHTPVQVEKRIKQVLKVLDTFAQHQPYTLQFLQLPQYTHAVLQHVAACCSVCSR